MLRLLIFLAVLGGAAYGLSWLADNPGTVTLVWRGQTHQVPLMVALGYLAAFSAALALAFSALRFVVSLPLLVTLAARARRRDKGFAALSRGMIAVGAGDAREAKRYADEADRYFGDEALTKLLRAQSAQLSGDRPAAVAVFHEMLGAEDTYLLGLRGLHLEARRAGDPQAALDYARRAYARARASWAAQAVLDDLAARGDWTAALMAVETDARAGLIDRPTSRRWRAVLLTALAQERAERDPKAALALAREALALSPALVPAAALAGKLAAATGELRRAARVLEAAYRAAPHPDLAQAYVRLRPGDSASDRLARARALARLAPGDIESALTVAAAAREAQDLPAARRALAPWLFGESVRPTSRACILMAEIEDAAGDDGAVREWLARAARARRDRAWVADGIAAERWSPAGPNGALDAFEWRTPPERAHEAPFVPPAPPPPVSVAPPVAPPKAEPVPAPSPPRAVRRVAAPSVLLANAPDDPGPHSERAEDFRKFALE